MRMDPLNLSIWINGLVMAISLVTITTLALFTSDRCTPPPEKNPINVETAKNTDLTN